MSECRHLCLQAQNAPDRMSRVDPPPGFAKAVGGKAPHTDQHSHSPDEVLASNFGRKLNLEDGSQGQFSHTLLHIRITCSSAKPCSCILLPAYCVALDGIHVGPWCFTN